MKAPVLHSIFSIALSCLVLFSTFSFTVEKHYCGDNLVDTAVFSEAKKCGGIDAETISYIKKPCCKDTVDVIEGQDELNTLDFEDLDQITKYILATHLYTYTQLYESLPKLIIPHKDYSPPNLVRDIQVLDETYLI